MVFMSGSADAILPRVFALLINLVRCVDSTVAFDC
jgi:hypothetical protein